MKKVSIHIQHYLPLLGVLIAGSLGYWLFSYDKAFQLVIAVATAAGYISWGVVHHHLHKDLTVGVILEYIAIALIGVFVILSLVFRA